MEKTDITIVGAGVIGLAVAREFSGSAKDVFVIEKARSFGQETSSRNSEVIHAGIYYPKDSLKARTCISGKELLYAFCAKNNLAHQRIGKLIVAIDAGELKELEALYKNGLACGVSDLKILSKQEIKSLQPHIQAEAAIWSASTGILDTHSFMKRLLDEFEADDGKVAFETELIGIEKSSGGYTLTVKDKLGENFKFFTRLLINCAGLDSERIAILAGMKNEEYKLKLCKGDYFRLRPAKAKFIKHLVYPVPKNDRAGLGIHATLDLSGQLRLGPDDEYVKEINYEVYPGKAKAFYESVKSFLPFVEEEDLSPDMAGIRPKLQGPREPFRDFIIKEEANNGFPGLINLIGIESPGFTASLAIADMVKKLAARL